jgi:hypothetical protein
VEPGTEVLHVAIDVGSDPISGSVASGDGEPRRFAGWVELAAEIETLRRAGRGMAASAAYNHVPGQNAPE